MTGAQGAGLPLRVHFHEIGVNELRAAIEARGAAIGVTLVSETFMPEADVLRCRLNGRDFNITCDLVYGSAVSFHASASLPSTPAEVVELEAALTRLCQRP